MPVRKLPALLTVLTRFSTAFRERNIEGVMAMPGDIYDYDEF